MQETQEMRFFAVDNPIWEKPQEVSRSIKIKTVQFTSVTKCFKINYLLRFICQPLDIQGKFYYVHVGDLKLELRKVKKTLKAAVVEGGLTFQFRILVVYFLHRVMLCSSLCTPPE